MLAYYFLLVGYLARFMRERTLKDRDQTDERTGSGRDMELSRRWERATPDISRRAAGRLPSKVAGVACLESRDVSCSARDAQTVE